MIIENINTNQVKDKIVCVPSLFRYATLLVIYKQKNRSWGKSVDFAFLQHGAGIPASTTTGGPTRLDTNEQIILI